MGLYYSAEQQSVCLNAAPLLAYHNNALSGLNSVR